MNPLMNMGGSMGNIGNAMQMMQRFQQFRSQFPKSANPNDILNMLLNSGRFTQEQVEQATQMAKQMGLIK